MSKILIFNGNRGSRTGNRFLQDSGDVLDFEVDDNGQFDVKASVFTDTDVEHRKVSSDRDWTNQELADLFRVKRLLNAAGVVCDIDRGLTDEGDPWCIFCSEDGEIFIHFCRIDGLYLLDSPSIQKPLRGMDFNALVSDFTNRAIPRAQADAPQDTERSVLHFQRGGKVRLHPSALLSALIWTLYLASEELVLVTNTREPDPSQGDASDTITGNNQASLVDNSAHDQIADNILYGDDQIGNIPELSDDLVAAVKPNDAHVHNLQWQQGLVVTVNAYAVGLSAIAIACGFMSERIWQDYRDKDLALLDEVGFDSLISDEMLADHNSAELAQPQDTVLEKLLEAVLSEDVSSDLAMLRGDVREIFRTAEAENWDGINSAELLAFAQLIEDETAGSSTTPDKFSGMGDEPTGLAQSEKDTGADINLKAGDGKPHNLSDLQLASFAFDSGAPDALINILSSWQPKLYETSLNNTQVYASFDPAVYNGDTISELVGFASADASEQKSSVGMDDAATESVGNLRVFDDAAQAFIDTLSDRSNNIDMIYYNGDLILVDIDTFQTKGAATHTMSWEYSDGSVITTVGLRSDFEAFDLIA